MSNIPSTPLDGNFKVVVAPTIALITAPKVTELSGGTAKDISCYLTGSGWNLSIDQASISDERLCDTFTAEQPGRKSVSLELTYIDNTNSANATTFNDAASALVEGTTVHLVTRGGKPFNGAFTATTDKVNVFKAVAGVATPLAPEANSVQRVTQKFFVQDYALNVAVAAGA